ncbi:MAG: diguanylate cyclase [Clostridia bacterium]|jgi:diguanylate cyclase (GGDEF)-like protein
MRKKIAQTIKDVISMVSVDKSLSREFKTNLIIENIKRYIYILSIVTLFQVVFIFLEAVGLVTWITSIFVMRAAIVAVSLTFILFLHNLRKKVIRTGKITFTDILLTFVQLGILLMGCFFAVFMFRNGMLSLSVLLLVFYIASLTCVKNPYYAGLAFFFSIIVLSIYIDLFVIDFSIWYGEFLIAFVFTFLLYVGNIMNYNRHLKLFIKEKEITELSKKLKIMSQTDDLTGVYNRRKITEVIEDYIKISKKYNKSFCIAIIDIDHFKNINDEYGHNTGDDILYYFTSNLKFLIKSTDILSRWGGDEFIMLMPNISQQEAYDLLEYLRQETEKYDFPKMGKVTFSAGICDYCGEEEMKILISKADTALYVSKKDGRNRVTIYNPDMADLVNFEKIDNK